jgi:hypothetical protein
MKNEVWYNRFMSALLIRHPKRSQLVEALGKLLHIEREAAYRRLRGDVKFSIDEIAKISSEWNISMDSILNISSGKIPFHMYKLDYINLPEEELKFMQMVIQSISAFKDFPDTEFMDICNKVPRQFLAGYSNLNQFYLFKWMYQTNENKPLPFSQIIISDKKRQLDADYYKAIKKIPNSVFIFDRMLFDHLVSEILYFHSIMMITDEEKELLKKDLHSLLDYLSEVAANGYYPETRNKVELYISQLNVDTNYLYTYTNQVSIFFVYIFDKYTIDSLDPEMGANFRKWMQLKKRTSIHISGMDEKSKIEFFMKQRQTINML